MRRQSKIFHITCLFVLLMRTLETTVAIEINGCYYNSTMDGYNYTIREGTDMVSKTTFNLSTKYQKIICPWLSITRRRYPNHVLEVEMSYMYMNASVKKEEERSTLLATAATLNITFFGDETKSGFNFMNSTFKDPPGDYNLQAPKWIFLYADENCSVVEDVSSTVPGHGADRVQEPKLKKKCQLLVKLPENGASLEDVNRNDTIICEKVFNQTCDTTKVSNFYQEELCSKNDEYDK